VIICELSVHLWDIVQNKKKNCVGNFVFLGCCAV